MYVKRGVYEENVRIGNGNGLKNMMMVGGGLRSTIVTGNHGVDGGSSLDESSTVGKR